MEKKGLLVVVSGFAGSGKGTLMKELIKRYSTYSLSVSATTRNPRPGEVDGREYYFKTTEEFEQMIEDDAFKAILEYEGSFDYAKDIYESGDEIILRFTIQSDIYEYLLFEEHSRLTHYTK